MDVILVLVGSAILIILGSYLASSVAEALQYHYSDALIAGFIALLQTLPEYAFVVILTMNYHPEYAMMSIIGANLLLIALGFPVIIFIAFAAGVKGITKDKSLDLLRENSLEAVFLAISGVYMIYLGMKGHIDLYDGVILMVIFILYIFIITHLPPEVEEEEPVGLARFFMYRKKLAFIVIIIGALVIWFSAEIFTEEVLHSVSSIITMKILLVMIIMPLVSEFPEKLTAYIAATRNEDMARLGVANFISSRINNGTLLFATMIFTAYFTHGFHSVPISSTDFPYIRDLMVMAGILSILGALTTIDRRITLPEAIVMFSIFLLLAYSIVHPPLLEYADIIMLIWALIIIGYAVKDKRFYWWSDIKYTLSHLKLGKKKH